MIRRVDQTGTRIQSIPVPLKYGPKEKWLSLLADPLKDKQVAIQLPIMAFQISSLNFDMTRKTNPLNKVAKVNKDNEAISTFQHVPYKLNIDLSIIAKNNDDMCQIYEQIIPYFTPTHFNSLILIPEIDYSVDIPVSLTSISIEDSYEGAFTERRAIIWTLSFELDVWFVGPFSNKGLIKRVQVDLAATNKITNVNKVSRNERVIITPGLTADGRPTTIYEESVPYLNINAEDDYGFVDREYTFFDGKYFDPKTGTDKE